MRIRLHFKRPDAIMQINGEAVLFAIAEIQEKAMRLFIAIQFDPATMSALMDLQKNMRSQGVMGNYTRPENLHLTIF